MTVEWVGVDYARNGNTYGQILDARNAYFFCIFFYYQLSWHQMTIFSFYFFVTLYDLGFSFSDISSSNLFLGVRAVEDVRMIALFIPRL